jgi:pyruvate/2-oxoglutarate dehydrogenase complex dihydrolipoamide dehydrogenase (E3) component
MRAGIGTGPTFVELMNAGATAASVRDAIHIHPTLAEAANNALLDALSA